MSRRKSSIVEDLFDIASKLPWWVGVLLALVAYVWLHGIAAGPITATAQPGQMGTLVIQQLFKTFAGIGQYLLPLVFLAGALASALGRAKRRSLAAGVADNPGPGALHGMSWQEFEMLVGEAFRQQGYAVAETGGGGADGGVDLVLKKGNEKFLVQCKQWKAFKVGVEIVRALYGVMAAQGATGGYVVTSGAFTAEARAFCDGRNITLIDGPALTRMLQDIPLGSTVKARAPYPPGSAPRCPKCGSEMVRRSARRGSQAGADFWGCSRYPACKGTRTVEP